MFAKVLVIILSLAVSFFFGAVSLEGLAVQNGAAIFLGMFGTLGGMMVAGLAGIDLWYGRG